MMQVGLPGAELVLLLLLAVVAGVAYLGYRLLRPSGEAVEDVADGRAEVGGMRYGFTRRQWALAAILAVYTLASPPPADNVWVALGGVFGAVFFVWAMVIIVRAARVGWAWAAGAIRS